MEIHMTSRSNALPIILVALGMAAVAPATFAQNAAAPGPGAGHMMMHGMMAQHGAMGMPFEHVEGRLAFLKTELKITDAQMPQWEKFAESVRSVARAVKGTPPMMVGGAHPTSAPALLDSYEKMLTVRLDAVRTVKVAFDPLYAAFADEQKKVADELLTSPMGLM
jgi:hypothetical protein